MANGQPPYGLGNERDPSRDQFREGLPPSAQDAYDQATKHGIPQDYRPPRPPGSPYREPEVDDGSPRPNPQTSDPQTGEPFDGSTGAEAGQFPFPRRGGPNVIDTSRGATDGQIKCPRCGSTDISARPGTGTLICHYCRYEWSEAGIEEAFGLDSPIGELRGTHVASGASNIQESTDDVITMKCQSCGSEVIVNTAEAMQARCHWCRNTLSISKQIPNGAVPDGVLPFKVTREDAISRISEFVSKRKFFAHPRFIKEFSPHEVVGVYLPYITLDANAKVALQGTGEVLTGTYTVKRGETYVRYYRADEYKVGRQFDLHVDDILMESSSTRADIDTARNTNNIINAIQPFDTKNAVTYNANYLRGFTSERRDLNIDALDVDGANRVLSIGRQRVQEMTRQYTRGIRWEQEQLDVIGTRWVALYLPVWLYSYYEPSTNLKHYVAVNGRTGETLGSVPVRHGRLFGISTLIGIIGTAVGGLMWYLTL